LRERTRSEPLLRVTGGVAASSPHGGPGVGLLWRHVAYLGPWIAPFRAPCSDLGMTGPTSGQSPSGRLTTARRKSLALDLLSQGHTLAHVKKVLGINRVTMYRWRQEDPSFAQAYSDAIEAGTGTDLIEQEARRRAVEGYDRPVFQRGRMVGVVQVYSDELAAMLLRGRRPEVYREIKSRSVVATSITIHGGLSDEREPNKME
jgi:hypothetical protein